MIISDFLVQTTRPRFMGANFTLRAARRRTRIIELCYSLQLLILLVPVGAGIALCIIMTPNRSFSRCASPRPQTEASGWVAPLLAFARLACQRTFSAALEGKKVPRLLLRPPPFVVLVAVGQCPLRPLADMRMFAFKQHVGRHENVRVQTTTCFSD